MARQKQTRRGWSSRTPEAGDRSGDSSIPSPPTSPGPDMVPCTPAPLHPVEEGGSSPPHPHSHTYTGSTISDTSQEAACTPPDPPPAPASTIYAWLARIASETPADRRRRQSDARKLAARKKAMREEENMLRNARIALQEASAAAPSAPQPAAQPTPHTGSTDSSSQPGSSQKRAHQKHSKSEPAGVKGKQHAAAPTAKGPNPAAQRDGKGKKRMTEEDIDQDEAKCQASEAHMARDRQEIFEQRSLAQAERERRAAERQALAEGKPPFSEQTSTPQNEDDDDDDW